MINFDNVSKFILSDLTLHIERGQVTGLIGDTGSGKTTLVRLASGLLAPDRGRVILMGKEPSSNRGKYGEKLGVLITGVPILEDGDTPKVGLEMLRYQYGISKVEFDARYKELSSEFGFESYENERVKDLSVGQRRRVELASVFIINPDLVILDEPDVGLDEEGRRILEERVQKDASRGVTFLITSHNLTGISHMCDRLAILSEGKLIFYGSETSLRSQYLPINTMTVTYEGDIPNIDDLPIVRYSLDGNRIAYDYNSKYIAASELLEVLMKQTKITDIKIKKPDLEKIIMDLH